MQYLLTQEEFDGLNTMAKDRLNRYIQVTREVYTQRLVFIFTRIQENAEQIMIRGEGSRVAKSIIEEAERVYPFPNWDKFK